MAVSATQVSWGGWPDCWRLSNEEVEVIVPAAVGPRLMRYGFVGGPNAFYEHAADLGGSGEPEFRLRGGHRLWTAPEQFPRTYVADNAPVEVTVRGGMLEAAGPVEGNTGLRKRLLIRMAATGSAVTVMHRLENTLPWAVEVAPWTVTMMAPGGTGFAGFPPRGTHPEMLAPTNPLVMWAFTDFSDPRWKLLAKYLVLRQDPARSAPQKAGLWNQNSWGAYWNAGQLFVKRYAAEPGKPYPDLGCSFEMWSNGFTLELETLGPLTTLAPGDVIEHAERWTLHRTPEPEWTDAGLDSVTARVL